MASIVHRRRSRPLVENGFDGREEKSLTRKWRTRFSRCGACDTSSANKSLSELATKGELHLFLSLPVRGPALVTLISTVLNSRSSPSRAINETRTRTTASSSVPRRDRYGAKPHAWDCRLLIARAIFFSFPSQLYIDFPRSVVGELYIDSD